MRFPKCSQCDTKAIGWSQTVPYCSEHFPKMKKYRKRVISIDKNKENKTRIDLRTIRKMVEGTNA